MARVGLARGRTGSPAMDVANQVVSRMAGFSGGGGSELGAAGVDHGEGGADDDEDRFGGGERFDGVGLGGAEQRALGGADRGGERVAVAGQNQRVLEGEVEAERDLAGADRGFDVDARGQGGEGLVDQLDVEDGRLRQGDTLVVGDLAGEVDLCGKGRRGEECEQDQ